MKPAAEPSASQAMNAIQQLVEAMESDAEFVLDPAINALRNAADEQSDSPIVNEVWRTWGVLLELAAAQQEPRVSEPLQFVLQNAEVLNEALSQDSLALELLAEIQRELDDRWGPTVQSLIAEMDNGAANDSRLPNSETAVFESVDTEEVDEDFEFMDDFDDGLNIDSYDESDAVSAAPSELDTSLLQEALAQMAEQHLDSPSDAGVVNSSAPARPADPIVDPIPEIDPELLEAFFDDADRCLGGLEEAALCLESEGATSAAIHRIGRELHTIKGAAACVGLKLIADLSHRAEELLEGKDVRTILRGIDDVTRHVEAVRDGTESGAAASTQATVEPSNENCNAVTDEERAQGGNSAKPDDIPPSQDTLSEPVGTPVSSGADAPAIVPVAQGQGPAVAPKAAIPAGPVGDSTQRIRTSQLDRLMDMLAELVMLRNRRHAGVDRLSGIHGDLSRSVEHFKRLTSKFAQAMDGLGEDDLRGCEATLGSLSEVADDLSHALRSLRGIYEPLAADNEQVSQFIGQFRHELAALRRMPVAGLFHKLRRVAREAANAEGKEVQLHFVGEDFGIEPAIQDRLYEPLIHIMRNSVSHGVETPEQRVALGKPRPGQVTLAAVGSAHLVQLEIRDDGRGLDYEAIRRRGIERKLLSPDRPVSREELAQLIFHPGFSTRDSVSQVSGRGVGLDVVAETLEQMRGWIDVSSVQGQGTKIRISLPLPSVIQHMMVFRSGGQLYGIPMQSLDFAGTQQNAVGATDARAILNRRLGKPLATELEAVSDTNGTEAAMKAQLLWVHSNGRSTDTTVSLDDDQELVMQTVGAVLSRAAPMKVDEILGPEEAVVRPLPPLLRHHPLVAGLSLSGNGEVVQLLDSHSLALHLEQYRSAVAEKDQRRQPSPPLRAAQHDTESDSERGQVTARVLVVDDSKTARMRIVRPLLERGIEVCQACDGAEALEVLKTGSFSAIFTDLEMPVMDGFELLYELQSRNTAEPVIVASTLQHRTHRQRTEALGAAEHLGKPVDTDKLVDTLKRWAPLLPLDAPTHAK